MAYLGVGMVKMVQEAKYWLIVENCSRFGNKTYEKPLPGRCKHLNYWNYLKLMIHTTIHHCGFGIVMNSSYKLVEIEVHLFKHKHAQE